MNQNKIVGPMSIVGTCEMIIIVECGVDKVFRIYKMIIIVECGVDKIFRKLLG